MATELGATVILNASASDEIIGKASYRRQLVSQQSARLYCAYAYADAGEGESTTDLVFAGENLVAENGSVLVKTPLFSCETAVADVDLDRLCAERRRATTWAPSPLSHGLAREVPFSFAVAQGEAREGEGAPATAPLMLSALDINRIFPQAPFVPVDAGDLAERCEEILSLQAAGLKTRLAHRAPSARSSASRAGSTPRSRCS